MKLRDNPFYVLNKGCGADREAINKAAEELSFFDEDGSIEKAQTALLNPATRLSAEMDWFPGLTKDQVDIIRKSVERDLPIGEENFKADILSWINIKAFNFQFIQLREEQKLQRSIEELDSLFSRTTTAEMIHIFRKTRKKANMPQVSEDEIVKEINRKRAEIRQIITEKLRPMEDSRYIRLITNLSEKLDVNQNNGGIIIDAVDQYELRMNDTIQEKTDEIKRLIANLKSSTDITIINQQVRSLIKRVRSWDQYVQPIQLKCQASGMTHEVSKDLGRELQQLSVFLHNERDATEAAAELAGAMRGVFAELMELAEDFHKAEELLSNLAEKNREAKEIVSEIEAFEKDAKMFPINWSNQSVAEQATGIGNRAAALSKKIKAMKGADGEDKKKLRTAVYMIARDVSIRAHNEHEESAAAYTLMNSLKKTFGDMPEWQSKLEEETDTLKKQADAKAAHEENRREADEIINAINAFKTEAESFPRTVSSQQILSDALDLGLQAGTLSNKIEALKGASPTDKNQLRTAVYMIAREAAIRAHNDYKQSEAAYTLMEQLKNTFGDMPELKQKIEQETETLKIQSILSRSGNIYGGTRVSGQRYYNTSSTGTYSSGAYRSNISSVNRTTNKKSNNDGNNSGKNNKYGIIALWAVMIALLVFAVKGGNGSTSYYSSPKPRTTATAAPSAARTTNSPSPTPSPKPTTSAREAETRAAKQGAAEVEKLISAIKEPFLENKDAIIAARNKYNTLSKEAKGYVKNLKVLTDAEQEIQPLLDEQAMKEIKRLYSNGDYEGTIAYAEDYYSDRDLQTVPDEFFDYVVWSYAQRSQQYEYESQYEKAVALMEKCVSRYSQTAYASKAQETLDHLNSKIDAHEPYNGQIIRATANSGYCEFTIKNGSDAALVKLESVSEPNQYYLEVYVREKETVTVHVRDGLYRLKYATGERWFSDKELFGSKTAYTKADTIISFETSYNGNYVYYDSQEVTLYKVSGGNMSTSPISEDDF